MVLRRFSLLFSLLSLVAVVLMAPVHAREAVKDAARPEAAKAEVLQPAPVLFDGKPLFTIQVRVLSLSPAERAGLISNKLQKLAKDPLLNIDALSVVDGETSSDIVLGDTIIMTVTESDAQAVGRGRQELAREYLGLISSAMKSHQSEFSLKSIMIGVGFTLLATIVLIILLKLLNKYFHKFHETLNSWRGTWIRSLRIKSIEILPADRLADMIIAIVKGGRVLLVLLLLYFYIPLVLGFFPWTRGYSAKIFGFILSTLGKIWTASISHLPNLAFIVIVIVITHYILKFIRLIFTEVEKGTFTIPGFYTDWCAPTYKLVRFLVIAFALVVIFPYIPGSDSAAFKGVSLFFGVLFSFGSSSAISNVVAGVILTYMRPFKLGERVKIADTEGDVVDRTLLVTRIRTIKNVDVTIPNTMILGSHIINYSSSAQAYGLILHTTVTIGYDAPWRQVHELLISAGLATEHILTEPKPFVLQTSLDDFYVSYQLNAYTDRPNKKAVIYSELHRNIQDKFNEGGVEIMSPHYSTLRDGNKTTIPESYLPDSYETPTFGVSATVKGPGSGE